jgi:hypothetical protein
MSQCVVHDVIAGYLAYPAQTPQKVRNVSTSASSRQLNGLPGRAARGVDFDGEVEREAVVGVIRFASWVGKAFTYPHLIPAVPLPAVLSLVEAAALLGAGRTTAYRLADDQQGANPALRRGRLIRIPPSRCSSCSPALPARMPNRNWVTRRVT